MEINRNNYEEFFLLCLDGELSPSENREVEEFLSEHADLQKEFASLQQAILPASEILFEPKELLFRREEKRRVIPFYKMRVAAAVALILAGSWLVLFIVHSRTYSKQAAEGREIVARQVKKDADHNTERNVIKRLQSEPVVKKADIAKITMQQHPVPVGKIKSRILRNDEQDGINEKQESAAIQGTQEENSQDQKELLQKTSVAGIQQHAVLSATKEPAVLTEIKPAPLMVATAGSNISVNAVPVKSEDQSQANNQTDNAISVIALNEKNKSITGFFKKLTRRAAPDPNERKLRVSVFQFSY